MREIFAPRYRFARRLFNSLFVSGGWIGVVGIGAGDKMQGLLDNMGGTLSACVCLVFYLWIF